MLEVLINFTFKNKIIQIMKKQINKRIPISQ